MFRNDDERNRAARVGIEDLNRKYGLHELAGGNVLFAATGVTDGNMLKGVRKADGRISTDSIVMRSESGTVRWIRQSRRLGDG